MERTEVEASTPSTFRSRCACVSWYALLADPAEDDEHPSRGGTSRSRGSPWIPDPGPRPEVVELDHIQDRRERLSALAEVV